MITVQDEIGEKLYDGIEILKCMMVGINTIIEITQSGFKRLGNKMDGLNYGIDKMIDRMLDKQDETISEIKKLRGDLKDHMDESFNRIENEAG